MTAQICDSIWIDGERQSLCVLPLCVLFGAMPQRPHFQSGTTANSRGYQATWRIEADWLWLAGLSGGFLSYGQMPQPQAKEDWRDAIALIESLEEDEGGAKLTRPVGPWRSQLFVEENNGAADERAARNIVVAQLLDSGKIPVKADWYSGLLRVPLGEELDYVHGGFLSITEFDLVLEIDRGAVRRRWMLDHRPAFAEEKRRSEALLFLPGGVSRARSRRQKDATHEGGGFGRQKP
jgi:hypothetical protein